MSLLLLGSNNDLFIIDWLSMGAPKRNVNAVKNGTRLIRLTVGELPIQMNSVKIEGRQYRRAMEAEVAKVHGEVSITDAHAINTATAATVHAGICRWLLREKIEKMTTADVLACSRELLRSKETRDRAVRLLDLDAGRTNILDALYSEVDDPPDNATTPTTVPNVAKEGIEGENISTKAKDPPQSKQVGQNKKGRKK